MNCAIYKENIYNKLCEKIVSSYALEKVPSAHSDQSPLAFPIISCYYLFISFFLSPHVSLNLFLLHFLGSI